METGSFYAHQFYFLCLLITINTEELVATHFINEINLKAIHLNVQKTRFILNRCRAKHDKTKGQVNHFLDHCQDQCTGEICIYVIYVIKYQCIFAMYFLFCVTTR